jgi:dTDP-4-amino-4,6-dideoxygalactose transaminase
MLGGAMKKRDVPVGYFETDNEMRTLVNGVLDSGRISYGPLCKRLEWEFARQHDSPFAVVSASGTDSLRAGLHALMIMYDWPYGSEVILPATTFVATFNIVEQLGLIPVLVDIEPDYFCMDSDKFDAAITDDTVAVIPVNLLGQPADLEAICSLAWASNLSVMEDSAEAMFVGQGGYPVGSWGEIGCFSFYMAHLITAGVGGIATTSNPDLADLMRSLLNHGRTTTYTSIDDDDDLTGEALEKVVTTRFQFLHSGYSSRMTELQAALALPQLANWEDMLARRQAVASRLTAGLSRHADRLRLPAEREEGEHSYMMYGIMLREGDKGPLVMHLEEHGIETREILPLVNQPIVSEWYGSDLRDLFDVSWDVIRGGFYIGCHQGMSDADADYVAEVVDNFFREEK